MMSSVRFDHPQEVHAAVGREVCVTDWVAIDQPRVDKFAESVVRRYLRTENAR